MQEREFCLFCKRPLTNMQVHSGGVCWDARCRSQALDREWGELRAEAARHRSIADPESYFIILISPQQIRPTPIPPERVEQFREYLAGVIDDARETEIETVNLVEDLSEPDRVRRWLGRICAACRGECCSAGKERAFLDVPAVHKQMRRYPDRHAAQIIDSYVEKVPAVTFGGSCIFQGEGGCSLPREDRAHICNIYECAGLRMARKLQAFGKGERAFVIAEEEGVPVEWTFVSLPGMSAVHPVKTDRLSANAASDRPAEAESRG